MNNDLISRSELRMNFIQAVEDENPELYGEIILDLIDNAPTINRLTTNLFIVGNGDVITTCGDVVGHVDLEKIT